MVTLLGRDSLQPGRNQPCPCGSGRKYKVCCLSNAQPSASVRAVQVRRLQAGLEPRLMAWARRNLGEQVTQPAWEDFTLQRYAIEPDGAESQLFEPWLLYNWRTRPTGVRGRSADQSSGLCIAELFVRWRAAQMNAAERDFLNEVITEPFSFYDVEGCEPGRSLHLRDILRGIQREVFEVSGSQGPRSGDIIFCRVVPFEGVNLIIGSGALIIPPDNKGAFLELRKSLTKGFGNIDSAVLRTVADRLIEIYFITRDQLVNPPAPKVCNSDGDPLLFHEITYEIDSPDVGFHALEPLAIGHTAEELRRQARLDRSGSVKQIEFPWVKIGNKLNPSLDNTILGNIRIDGRRLTVEVNSERRAKRIMGEIKKRLKGGATHLETKAKSTEAVLRSPPRDLPHPTGRLRAGKSGDFVQHPEVQAKIRSMIEAHWQSWPEHPLPALKDQTPLDAVKDPEGREMVEALLFAAERHEQENPQAGKPFDFTPIRRRLGLRLPK